MTPFTPFGFLARFAINRERCGFQDGGKVKCAWQQKPHGFSFCAMIGVVD
jgi:hypothetical protein